MTYSTAVPSGSADLQKPQGSFVEVVVDHARSSRCRALMLSTMMGCVVHSGIFVLSLAIGVGDCINQDALADDDQQCFIEPGRKSFRFWETVPQDTKEALRGFIGNVDVRSNAPLSEADARLLATVRGGIGIEAPGLSPVAVRVLCSRQGSLGLYGVSELSAEMAEILGTCSGPLGIPYCHDLEASALRSLVKENRYGLWMGGMRLTAEHARILAGFGGHLKLGPLSLLDEKAVTTLQQYRSDLDLTVVELSPPAATALGHGNGKLGISLGVGGGPVHVTERMAADLCPHQGRLSLRNVTFDPCRKVVLAALAQHKGELELFLQDGESLTVGEAMALSGLREQVGHTDAVPTPSLGRSTDDVFGDLMILGRVEYSANVAGALAGRLGGKLAIEVYSRLGEDVAASLAKHRGPLAVIDRSERAENGRPSAAAVASLCAHQGSLDLPGQWIRADTIESVLAHEGGLTVDVPGSFVLSGTLSVSEGAASKLDEFWEWMPSAVLRRLTAYSQPLHIRGEATDEVVQVLANHSSDLALDQLPRGEVGLRALLKRKGRLFLSEEANVDSVTKAEVFASQNNQTAVCTSSHMIGPNAREIATILIKRQGPISFPYLEYIDAEALRILATKSDVRLLELDRIYILSDGCVDVEPRQVVSERFIRMNAENQPPPEIPKWHSWDRLLSADAEAK